MRCISFKPALTQSQLLKKTNKSIFTHNLKGNSVYGILSKKITIQLTNFIYCYLKYLTLTLLFITFISSYNLFPKNQFYFILSYIYLSYYSTF